MLSQVDLLSLIHTNKLFIELIPQSGVDFNKALNAREMSTSKSSQKNTVDEMLKNQGSPGLASLSKTIKKLMKEGLIPELKGIGIELGSGSAALSKVFIEKDYENKIEYLIALEAVKQFCIESIPRMKNELPKKFKHKLVPAYGSFNQLPVKDSTFDFEIQIESFHHSEDMFVTAQEAFRILKPGGYLISLDRSWVDSTSDVTIQEFLNHEYSENWLNEKGFPIGSIRTRRDNGEHEYRDREWRYFFESAGFELVTFLPLQPQLSGREAAKRIIGILGLGKLFGIKVSARRGLIRSWIFNKLTRQTTSVFGLLQVDYPRPLVLIAARKPETLL